MSQRFDSGFQCLGVPMSQGRENHVELIKKVGCRHNDEMDTTAYHVSLIRPYLKKSPIPGSPKISTTARSDKEGRKSNMVKIDEVHNRHP